MCFSTRLWRIVLCASLIGCRTAPNESGYDLYEAWSVDSIRHALEAGKLNGMKLMTANGGLGLKYFMSGQYDSARIYLRRALDMPGGREFQGGRLITNLANSYGFEGNYTEAMRYYMDALGEAERHAATKRNRDAGELNVVRALANLAEIHYLTGNRKQAFRCASQACARNRTNEPNYITPQYLYVMGSVYLDQGDWDRAEESMRHVFGIADTLCRRFLAHGGDPSGMYMYVAYGKEGLAKTALCRGEYDRALEYAFEALDYAALHGDPTITAKMLSSVSDIYLARGDYPRSGTYALRAMEAAPDHAKLNPDAAFNAATSYLFSGDAAQAYTYYGLYRQRVRENTDMQFRETMAGMEVTYETEKKEMRIANLERQRILFLGICAACILLAMTVWAVLRQRVRSERREKELVAANAVIEWEKKERKRFANDLHDGINGILSAIKLELNTVNGSQKICGQLDDCIETIRRMSRRRIPVSLERYGLRAALEDYCRLFPQVNFHFYGDDHRMGEGLELTVYYSAYELVNNAVKHSGAVTIDVELVQEGDSVSLTVQDDGCGFDDRNALCGSGLENIRERIAVFGGKMDVASSPGAGTETVIKFT